MKSKTHHIHDALIYAFSSPQNKIRKPYFCPACGQWSCKGASCGDCVAKNDEKLCQCIRKSPEVCSCSVEARATASIIKIFELEDYIHELELRIQEYQDKEVPF